MLIYLAPYGIRKSAVKAPSMIMDSIVSLAIATKLGAASYAPVNFNSFVVAKTEVREGMYKSYSIDVSEEADKVSPLARFCLEIHKLPCINSSYYLTFCFTQIL
jgi:hypothetical protein